MAYEIVKKIVFTPSEWSNVRVKVEIVKPDKHIIDNVGFDDGNIVGLSIANDGYIDTNDLRSIGKQLIGIAQKIDKEYDQFGRKLQEVPDVLPFDKITVDGYDVVFIPNGYAGQIHRYMGVPDIANTDNKILFDMLLFYGQTPLRFMDKDAFPSGPIPDSVMAAANTYFKERPHLLDKHSMFSEEYVAKIRASW